MGRGLDDNLKICKKCGDSYFNVCLRCAKAGIEERVYELMNKHMLNEDELIRILADQVKDGKFAALNLAILLRGLKPADKHEVDINEGKKLSDAKDGIHNLLSRLVRGKKTD